MQYPNTIHMGLFTFIFTMSIAILTYALTRAKKMNSILQVVLCFIGIFYALIIPGIDNLLVSRLVLAIVASSVNLSLVLFFLKQLPKIKSSFLNRPLRAYLLLTLASILLIAYITFLLFIGLLGVNFKLPILMMALSGGFIVLVAIPFLVFLTVISKLKLTRTLNAR